jgi:mono/diheme cytochrome c family protein
VTANNFDAVANDAATLKRSFATALEYWTAKKADDAIGLARGGAKAADDLESAAKAKNAEGVTAAQRALGATCGTCHTAHRERLQDGSFEIK